MRPYHVLIDYTEKTSGTAADFYINIQDSLPANIKTWDVKLLFFSHQKNGISASAFTSLIIKSSLVPGVVGSEGSLKNNLLGLHTSMQTDIPYDQPSHRIERPVLNNVHIQLIASDATGQWGTPKWSGATLGESTTILLEFKPVYQDDIQDRYLDSLKRIWKPL